MKVEDDEANFNIYKRIRKHLNQLVSPNFLGKTNYNRNRERDISDDWFPNINDLMRFI